jgi:hypothetical protein
MPPTPLTLDLADEMGMLIIGAPPIECMNQWPALTPQLERRWAREMEQMILRDRNHPAIICWETGNEVVRRSLYLLRHKVSLAARRLDPTRLVIDESGGRSWSYGGDSGRHNKNANYDGITFARGPHIYLPGSTTPVPIEDHHLYLPAPVNEKDYHKLATIGTDGGLTFVSEVGYGGWPDMAADVARYHREGNPKTPDYRFHEHLLASLEKVMTAHKLGELFPDVPALCRASQQIQADGNKLQMEAMRLNPKLGGYCLHAFTDGDWVLGAGVLDLWREPKLLYHSVKAVQQPLYLAMHTTPQNIYAQKGARLRISAVNAGPAVSGELVVGIEGAAWHERRAVEVGSGIQTLLEVDLKTEVLRGPQTITARIVRGTETLVSNRQPVWVFAGADLKPAISAVTIVDTKDKLKNFFAARGVATTEFRAGQIVKGPVIVGLDDMYADTAAGRFTALMDHVKDGGTAVWLHPPTDRSRLVTNGIVPFKLRRQEAWGRWIPVNHYTRPHPIFAGLPGGGFLGQAWANVVPRFTLMDLPGAPVAGCVSWDCIMDYTGPTDVWHGTDLAILPHGKGRFILSMFGILENIGTDPVADKLLLNLCAFAAAPDATGIEPAHAQSKEEK